MRRSIRTYLALGATAFAATGFALVGGANAATPSGCGQFKVILPNGKTAPTGAETEVDGKNLTANSILKVRGTYVEFDVKVATMEVLNYTLTGAPNTEDLTEGQRTVLFASKKPELGGRTLNKDLEIDVPDNGNSALVLLRRGSIGKIKVQAKDCAAGGIFQMEPELETGGTLNITHRLAPGIFYFINPYTGKLNFGDGVRAKLKGKDSPQVATRLSQTDTESVWSVSAGGRMGGVLGEDAVELSAGSSNCVQDCQAQNRIRGSVPVTDPAFSS